MPRDTAPAAPTSTVSIEGRPALEVTPIKQRGQMMGPVPLWAEVAFAAVEDRTEGTVVVDGVMLGIGLTGQVDGADRVAGREGQGGRDRGRRRGRAAREVIHGVEDATVIGEFAFGTSEKSPYGSPSEKGRSARSTSRSATTTTPIPAARTSARSIWTASS